MENSTFQIIAGCLLILFQFSSCKKDGVSKSSDNVTTGAVSAIGYFSATGNGSVKVDGVVRQRGICWSTHEFPNISDFITIDPNPGSGNFSNILVGLDPSTKYWVRAYAQTDAGNIYGDEVSFTTPTLVLGQSLFNGILFFVDSLGHHGLIAAPADQATIGWSNGANVTTNASSETDGLANTGMISDVQGDAPPYAASVCMDIESNGVFFIWFLPSKNELDLMYKSKDLIGGFSSNLYWSSTENDTNNAWTQDFSNGTHALSNKTTTHHVRAIRSF